MSSEALNILNGLNGEGKRRLLEFGDFLISQREPETLYDYQEEVSRFSCDMTDLRNLIEILESNYFQFDSESMKSHLNDRAIFAYHYQYMQTLVNTIRQKAQEMTGVIKELSDINLESLEQQSGKGY